jgi:hypothetical protein
VIDADGADPGPRPVAFAAVTENVYSLLGSSPVTLTGEVAPNPCSPPGYAVTV